MAAILSLSRQTSLAIVELALSSVIFFISTFATCYKGHQLTTQTHARALLALVPRGILEAPGFFWLSTLCLTHIVGSACYISYQVRHLDQSYGNVYAITSFIGSAPLLLATSSFLHFPGSVTNTASRRFIGRVVQVIIVIAFAIGLAGGVQRTRGYDQQIGSLLLQISAVIFHVTVITLVALAAINLSTASSVRALAMVVAMPFLGVRVLYNLLTAFGSGDIYDFNLPSLPVQIFTRIIMEYIVVFLYLFDGLGILVHTAQDEEAYTSQNASKELEEGQAHRDFAADQAPQSSQTPEAPQPHPPQPIHPSRSHDEIQPVDNSI